MFICIETKYFSVENLRWNYGKQCK